MKIQVNYQEGADNSNLLKVMNDFRKKLIAEQKAGHQVSRKEINSCNSLIEKMQENEFGKGNETTGESMVLLKALQMTKD